MWSEYLAEWIGRVGVDGGWSGEILYIYNDLWENGYPVGCNPSNAGSNPVRSFVAVAERFKAPDCGSGFRGFESPQSPRRSKSKGATPKD